jgi:hypothetical protein
MKKNRLKIINTVLILFLLFLLYLQYRNKRIQYVNSLTRQITDGFYGQKLASNYYQFYITDYHRTLMFNQPFLLYFYDINCVACIQEDQIIHNAVQMGLTRDKIIFRVNFSGQDKFHPEAESINTYKIPQVNTWVVVNKDSAPLKIELGQMQMEQIKDLLQLIQ